MKQECWPEFAEKWLWWLPKFKSCAFHDARYKKARIRNEEVRAKIDRIFYYQMLAEKPNHKITAKIYYTLVRLFWWIIFYKTKTI